MVGKNPFLTVRGQSVLEQIITEKFERLARVPPLLHFMA